MIYSMACEYAIRAMTTLAEIAPEGEYCLLRRLAQEGDLPRAFVGKIFQTMVRAGLLNSAKGRGGGFALKRPAAQISLLEIVDAVDGTERLNRCAVGLAECDDHQPCPLHEAWKPLRAQIQAFLENTTVADMTTFLDRKRRSGAVSATGARSGARDRKRE